MRLTKRCLDLFRMLRAARWLTTAQIHRRFFATASLDAARKRLRKLVASGYLARFRANRMSEAMFALAREGKRTLERAGGRVEVHLERRPPKQWEHFVGINDVRVAVELSGSVSYFFACWELPALGWRWAVIPDAVFALRDRTFVVEFDRGSEDIRFFMSTKMATYRRGLDGLPLTAILVVTDSRARFESLAKAIGNESRPVLYSTIDLVREHGIAARVFYRPPSERGISLGEKSLVELSCRQESLGSVSSLRSDDYEIFRVPSSVRSGARIARPADSRKGAAS